MCIQIRVGQNGRARHAADFDLHQASADVEDPGKRFRRVTSGRTEHEMHEIVDFETQALNILSGCDGSLQREGL